MRGVKEDDLRRVYTLCDLEKDLIDHYFRIKQHAPNGIPPHRFRNDIGDRDPVATVRKYLHRDGGTERLHTLNDTHLLGLGVEMLVLDPRKSYYDEFTEEDRYQARLNIYQVKRGAA